MSSTEAHIMLVEDSVSQATKMTYILEEAGWRVTWVATPQAALDRLNEERPDLVLLDFYLPGMQGDEVCRRIRRNIDTRNLPVVMLTSEETNEAELRGLESGADDFIAKSADSDVLVLRLRTLMNKVQRQSEILSPSKGSFRSARLLAIDDSPTFLARLRPELESEGYEVETMADPSSGLNRVKTEPFDGVLIDLVMPGMDGLELCRRIDEMRKHMEAPLVTVMLTGRETKEDHSRALEAGADDFVGKSSDISVLKGRIRALLRRKFFEEENRRILDELREKEMEALRERAAKEVAEARANLVEQLQRTAEELRRSQAELQQANQAKDHFLAILSHELRTPLTPVLATVSSRQDDPQLPPDLRDEVAMIKRNIELEARLIDDLLDLTRITQGKLEIRCQAVSMRDLVANAVEICRPQGDQAPKIITRLEARHGCVWGDSSRLSQVLWNLIRNAVKFTPPQGSVTVSMVNEETARGHAVVVEVADSGIGIEPAMLPRIFNAFEQGGRDVTRQFGGLGLGLAISKAIADLHGGTLTASSEGLGKGAQFRFTLPVQEQLETNEEAQDCQTPPAQSSPAGIHQQPMQILLVEDHTDTATALRRLLSRRGHSVTIAGSVQEAAALAQSNETFNVLISDLGLPDGTGFDVLQAVTQHQRVQSIALSGFGMEEDVQRSLQAGFQMHLTKPVDFSALEQALTKLPTVL